MKKNTILRSCRRSSSALSPKLPLLHRLENMPLSLLRVHSRLLEIRYFLPATTYCCILHYGKQASYGEDTTTKGKTEQASALSLHVAPWSSFLLLRTQKRGRAPTRKRERRCSNSAPMDGVFLMRWVLRCQSLGVHSNQRTRSLSARRKSASISTQLCMAYRSLACMTSTEVYLGSEMEKKQVWALGRKWSGSLLAASPATFWILNFWWKSRWLAGRRLRAQTKRRNAARSVSSKACRASQKWWMCGSSGCTSSSYSVFCRSSSRSMARSPRSWRSSSRCVITDRIAAGTTHRRPRRIARRAASLFSETPTRSSASSGSSRSAFQTRGGRSSCIVTLQRRAMPTSFPRKANMPRCIGHCAAGFGTKDSSSPVVGTSSGRTQPGRSTARVCSSSGACTKISRNGPP
mmetsp:Transcript_19501/g.60207  ORF Transcript_19501/g.60207 Transcript_19501/m.60207 type:complete len:405 (+) Transcript_19501:282-1496(+)